MRYKRENWYHRAVTRFSNFRHRAKHLFVNPVTQSASEPHIWTRKSHISAILDCACKERVCCDVHYTVNPGYYEPFCTLANASLCPGIRFKGRNFPWIRQGGAHWEDSLYSGFVVSKVHCSALTKLNVVWQALGLVTRLYTGYLTPKIMYVY